MNEAADPTEKKIIKKHPMLVVLGTRNLRFLWLGQAIAVLGSQFYLIALPWLVLQLTGDPFQMGTVLAVAGIPRAIFMLVGGVFTDRFSPRTMMIYANLARMLVLAALTVLVLHFSVSIWMIYALSLVFGLADAFYYPAQSSIMPRIVDSELLLAGNSIVQGTVQLSIAAGPALAGALIAFFSRANSTLAVNTAKVDLLGIGMAFGFNTVAYCFSILMFWLISLDKGTTETSDESGQTGTMAFLKEGLTYVFKDPTLRLLLLVTSVSHFLVEGPLFIGIPVLAKTVLPEGAAAYGIIMSGLGAGMLIGIILAGFLPKLPPDRMGTILLLVLSSSGFELMTVGYMPNTISVALVVMFMGAAQGYVVIQYSTWMQIRTPKPILGRVLSMMMFASVGLIPVSQALCGALIKLSLPGLFLGAGIILTVINLIVATRPSIRNMGLAIVDKASEPLSPSS